MGYQEEKGESGRLLDSLEQAVGRFLVHPFGEINHNCAVAPLQRAEREHIQNPLGLLNLDHRALALDFQSLGQVIFSEIWIRLHQRAPGAQIIHAGTRVDREDETHVRVNHLPELVAGRTDIAAVPVLVLAAVQVLKEGKAYDERTPAVILMKHQRVGHPPGIDHPGKSPAHICVSCNVRESHIVLMEL